MNRLALLSATLAFVVTASAQQPQPAPADTLFLHGEILTGVHLQPNDNDPVPARVHALAVRDGRIIAVGTDDQMLAFKGPHTEVVDLAGQFAMPGFNDAHTHIAEAGLDHLSADLHGVASLAEMQSRIRSYAATLKPGQWIVGGGWDHTRWPGKTLPTRQDLDAVTGDHPAFLDRVDGHIAVANTAALQAAGITDTTPDPKGGKFDHDASGHLTGIIRETPAKTLIEQHIPSPDFATRGRALELSIQDALAHGVTSVQDFSTWDDWLVLEELEHQKKLPIRVYEWVDFNLPVTVLEQRRAGHDPNDPLLHMGMLKAFMDGSLGSRTAALNAPYSDEPNNSGLARYDADKLNAMTTDRAAAGFQLGFHAIGDRANDMALDAFEAAEQAGTPASAYLCQQHELQYERSLPPDAIVTRPNPCPAAPYAPRDFRFRIEHAQVVSPGAFDRFAALGVIASMQPSHLLTDMAWAGQRLGPERSKRAYAWHSFLTHGVTLAFGTDYPVESINPMRGLYAAIDRMNEAATQSFEPQEKLTINQAIYAYT
ncbi:MAG TPA: amidohydrolase, partial [Acidobacteriaceae bacterium]|nr:amidohydrolase [Acidobacteriaceae bacterium]